jgi:uroporphyrinogen-III synthase
MRVLLTRAEADAEKSARRLVALGHQPVVRPLARIVATGQALPPGPFDAVAVTSPHALHGIDVCPISGLPAYAVGSQTALAARNAGFRTVREGLGTAVALAAQIIADLAVGARVLFLTGNIRKTTLETRLIAAGLAVTIIEVYRVEPEPRGLQGDDLTGIEAVLHYSRASAERFAAAVKEGRAVENARKAFHLCLSDDVAKGLVSLFPLPILVAARPEEGSLFALLAICRS